VILRVPDRPFTLQLQFLGLIEFEQIFEAIFLGDENADL